MTLVGANPRKAFFVENILDGVQDVRFDACRHLPGNFPVDLVLLRIVDACANQNGFTRRGAQECRIRQQTVAAQAALQIRCLLQQMIVHVRAHDIHVWIVANEVEFLDLRLAL